MPRTTITPVLLPKPFVTTGPVDPVLAASDQVNGNQFLLTGKEFVIVRNVNAGAQTVTVTSAPSPITSRLGNITAISIPAAAIRVFQLFTPPGWRQPVDGMLYLDTGHVDVEFAVVRIP